MAFSKFFEHSNNSDVVTTLPKQLVDLTGILKNVRDQKEPDARDLPELNDKIDRLEDLTGVVIRAIEGAAASEAKEVTTQDTSTQVLGH